MHDCEFDRNAAQTGGAVFRGSSNGNLAGSVFRNNTAQQYGGAVYDSHVQVRRGRAAVRCGGILGYTQGARAGQDVGLLERFIAGRNPISAVDRPSDGSVQSLTLKRI